MNILRKNITKLGLGLCLLGTMCLAHANNNNSSWTSKDIYMVTKDLLIAGAVGTVGYHIYNYLYGQDVLHEIKQLKNTIKNLETTIKEIDKNVVEMKSEMKEGINLIQENQQENREGIKLILTTLHQPQQIQESLLSRWFITPAKKLIKLK